MTESIERAREAVLEMALDEAVGNRRPPVEWPVLRQRVPPRALSRPRPWLWAAAVLVIGGAVLLAVHGLTGPGPREATLPAERRPLDAPASLDEVRQWLAVAPIEVATLTPVSLYDAAAQRSVSLRPLPLEGLFRYDTSEALDDDLRRQLRVALRDARQSTAAFAAAPGEHELVLHLGAAPGGESRRLLLRLRGGAREPHQAERTLHAAVVGKRADWVVGLPAPLRRELLLVCDAVTRAVVQGRGIVFGGDALAALPADTTRLAVHRVPASGALQLERLSALTHLDLRGSPALHHATALGRLRACKDLASLTLDGRHLDQAAIQVLGGLHPLRELFLISVEDDLARLLAEMRMAPADVQVDDTAAAVLARLRGLRELVVSGPRLTDAGLAQLARLRELRSLALVNADEVRGTGMHAFAGHPALRSVWLAGEQLELPALAAALANTEVDTLVCTLDPRSDAVALPLLAHCPGLSELTLDACGREASAAEWRMLFEGLRASRVEKLGLLRAGVTDRDLDVLRSLPALESVDLVDCPRLTAGVEQRLAPLRIDRW